MECKSFFSDNRKDQQVAKTQRQDEPFRKTVMENRSKTYPVEEIDIFNSHNNSKI